MRPPLTSIICICFVLISEHSLAQEDLGYRTKMADSQANYYSIVAETDSLLKAALPDTSWESQDLFFARWKWFWGSRMGDAIDGAKTGKFSHYAGVMKSMVQTPPCMNASAYPANWNLLGPIQLPRQEMGRIDAVAQDPNNPSVAYAGAPNGGLWRTTDIDAAEPLWQNITDQTGLPGMGIGDILIDPTNSDIIYIATGYYTGSEVTYGVGVMKTSNGTDPLPSWEATGLNFNPFQGEVAAVKKLIMSPVDHNTIYAYTAKEVYKTTDAGANWTSLGLNTTINDDQLAINDMALDPLDNASIMVSLTKPDGFLWRWNASSAQWTDRTNELSATPHPYANGTRYPVYFSRCNNDVYVLYRTSGDYRIDISHDGGITWSLPVITNNYGPWFIVSPENADIMYLGDGTGRVIYKSINGGSDFVAVTSYNNATTHADIRALRLIHSTSDGLHDTILAGTDGGVLYSTSANAPTGTSVSWRNINGIGLTVGQFFGLAGSEKVPGRIVVGAQDNGVAAYNDGAWTSHVTTIGDAYDGVIDHDAPSNLTIERIGWGGHLNAAGYNMYFKTSSNGGSTWNGSIVQPEWGNPANPDNYLSGNQPYSPDVWNVLSSPIQIDHDNNMYLGFHDLFRYDPANSTWTPLSDFTILPQYYHDPDSVAVNWGCSAFAIAPSNREVIYFAFEGQTWDPSNTTRRKLWRTTNGGGSWSDITTGLAINWYGISGIAVDPDNTERAWVSLGNIGSSGNLAEPYNGSSRVYYTSDGGATWTDYSMGLTPLPINVITYEQGSNDGLYVGTDVGVFYTNRTLYNADDIVNPQNTGWVCFRDNLPPCIVTDLEVNYASNRLRASTYGRGIWESSLACPLYEDLYFTSSTAIGLSGSFQEAVNDLSVVADAGDIYVTDCTGRAGNELHVSASGQSGVHIGANSHLFIHPCDGPGNTFHPKIMEVGNTGNLDKEESGASKLQVFPNPSTGRISVILRDVAPDQLTDIRLFDGIGKLMFINQMTGNTTTLDIHLPDGIYTLLLTYGNEELSARIILKAS